MLTSPNPTLLPISNGLALRYEKTGERLPARIIGSSRTRAVRCWGAPSYFFG